MIKIQKNNTTSYIVPKKYFSVLNFPSLFCILKYNIKTNKDE